MPRRKQHCPKRMKYTEEGKEAEAQDGDEADEEGDDDVDSHDGDDDNDDTIVDMDVDEADDVAKASGKPNAYPEDDDEVDDDEELRHKVPCVQEKGEVEVARHKEKLPRNDVMCDVEMLPQCEASPPAPHATMRPKLPLLEESTKPASAVSVIVPATEPLPPSFRHRHRSSRSEEKAVSPKHKKMSEKHREAEFHLPDHSSNSVMKLHSLVESVERNARSSRQDKYGRSSHMFRYDNKKSDRQDASPNYSRPIPPSSSNVENTFKRIYSQYLPPAAAAAAATARSPSPAPNSTPSPDPNMPLDLSKKTPTKSSHSSVKHKKHMSPASKYTSNSATDAGSSLESLEKKFGGDSAILERVGTKPPGVPNRNAFMSAFGVNLYSTALYSTQPMLPSTQFQQRFHHPQASSYSHQHHHTEAGSKRCKEAVNTRSGGVTSTSPSHHSPKVSHRSDRSDYHCGSQSSSSIPVSSSSSNKHYPPTTNNSPKYIGSSGSVDEHHDDKKHTNLQCSCSAEFETLYKLTIHHKETGHPPNRAQQTISQEYPKLVRGQDMWLNQGSEQTRQILRCMQCGESFKTLPELTVHMIQTKHYANIVGADPQKKMMKDSSASYSDSSDGEATYRCKVCRDVFDDIDALQHHVHVTGHMIKMFAPQRSLGSYSPSADHSRDNQSDGDSSSIHSPPGRVTSESSKERLSNGDSPFGNHGNHQPSGRDRSKSRERDDSVPVGASKIRCENCADKIDTSHFVEHVRVCVKNRSSSPVRRHSGGDREHLKQEKPKRAHRFDFSCYLPKHLNGEVKIKNERPSPRPTEADSSNRQSPLSEGHNKSPELVKPPPATSNVSALQDMESFIERSFSAAKAKKPRHSFFNHSSKFFASPFMHQAMAMSSMRNEHRQPEPPPTRPKSRESPPSIASTLLPPSTGLYQNKYLPPSYPPPAPEPSEGSSRPSSTNSFKQEDDNPISDHGSYSDRESPARSDVKDKNDNEMKSPMESESPRESNSEPDRQINDSKKDLSPVFKQEQQEPPNDRNDKRFDTSDEKCGRDSISRNSTEKGHEEQQHRQQRPSSPPEKSPEKPGDNALESLQGLVYGKSFNTEHPLDSLQKLIHNTNTPVSGQYLPMSTSEKPPTTTAASSQSMVAMSGALTQALPGTVILVNPIVTVVPGSDGANPSVQISMPSQDSPRDLSKDSSRDSPFDDGDRKDTDSDSDQSGEYHCGACKRTLASKGAYRYHLSRCHVLKYGIKDAINTSPYVYLPLDHTAKFTKYYEMANELANKGK